MRRIFCGAFIEAITVVTTKGMSYPSNPPRSAR
jgi:hypothetical protein